MKKSGFMILENLLSLVIIIVIGTSVCLSVNFFENVFKSYEHTKFKNQFLDFINLGKYKAFINSSVYTLRFSEKGISLVDKSQITVNRLNFPKSIKMIKFNGIYDRNLTIQRNGLIPRGATFTYKFYDDINKITIAAVTGKVNYD